MRGSHLQLGIYWIVQFSKWIPFAMANHLNANWMPILPMKCSVFMNSHDELELCSASSKQTESSEHFQLFNFDYDAFHYDSLFIAFAWLQRSESIHFDWGRSRLPAIFTTGFMCMHCFDVDKLTHWHIYSMILFDGNKCQSLVGFRDLVAFRLAYDGNHAHRRHGFKHRFTDWIDMPVSWPHSIDTYMYVCAIYTISWWIRFCLKILGFGTDMSVLLQNTKFTEYIQRLVAAISIFKLELIMSCLETIYRHVIIRAATL